MNLFMKAAGATLAASVAMTIGAFADSPHALLARAPGSTVSYNVQFDGSFWNGQRITFDRTATVSIAQDGAVAFVSTGKGPNDNATLAGALQSDGTISAKDTSGRLDTYNTVAGILQGAPATLQAGAVWNGQIPIETGDAGQVSYLPVQLKVVSSDNGTSIVQGTGSQSLTASYSGYTIPVDVTAKFALRLTPTGFDRCDFAATEVVHAGPQTQTMQWSWHMTRVGSAQG
jgi:hypothetical protein